MQIQIFLLHLFCLFVQYAETEPEVFQFIYPQFPFFFQLALMAMQSCVYKTSLCRERERETSFQLMYRIFSMLTKRETF